MRTIAILLASVAIICATPAARAASDDAGRIRELENRLATAVEARNINDIMKAYIPD